MKPRRAEVARRTVAEDARESAASDDASESAGVRCRRRRQRARQAAEGEGNDRPSSNAHARPASAGGDTGPAASRTRNLGADAGPRGQRKQFGNGSDLQGRGTARHDEPGSAGAAQARSRNRAEERLEHDRGSRGALVRRASRAAAKHLASGRRHVRRARRSGEDHGKESPAPKKVEPPKPAAPVLGPPRLVKTVKPHAPAARGRRHRLRLLHRRRQPSSTNLSKSRLAIVAPSPVVEVEPPPPVEVDEAPPSRDRARSASSRRTTGCRRAGRRAPCTGRRSTGASTATTDGTVRSADDPASHRGAGQDAATGASARAGQTSAGDAAAHRARHPRPRRPARSRRHQRPDGSCAPRPGGATAASCLYSRRARRRQGMLGGPRPLPSQPVRTQQPAFARPGAHPLPRDNSLDRHLGSGRPAEAVPSSRPARPAGLGANGRRHRRCPLRPPPRRRSRASSRWPKA